MKYFARAVLPVVLCLFLFACKSTQFYVPGEKKVLVQSVYSEYYSIAEEYFKLKNYSKAAEFYNKASSLKSLNNASLFNAARCYALSKNWDKALEIYLEIEKHDPQNIEVKQSLAYIYAMTNEFDKSEELYKKLLQEKPDVSEVLVNYTIVLLTQEKFDDAKTNLVLLKEKFPDEEKIKSIEEKITKWEEEQKQGDGQEIPEELKEEIPEPNDSEKAQK